ncbi:MAG: RidA family protein [Granulosicoccus sp.]
MSEKTHSWPEGHWYWNVKTDAHPTAELSHYHGVNRGGLIYTGGQADLDTHGAVVNPDNLDIQTRNVLQFAVDILEDFNASLKQVIKFVIYFTGDSDDEAAILNLIAERLPDSVKPAVSTICLPELCYPGMRIELEAVAASDEHAQVDYYRGEELPALHTHFSHAVSCQQLIMTSDMTSLSPNGDVRAPGDVIEQTRIMMTQLDNVLKLAGASASDVVKLNVFYQGDGTAENWEEPARIRADFFPEPGPAATGIAVTGFADPAMRTQIAVTAAVKNESAPAIQYAWPEGHWDWTTHLPYKHGNRIGNVIHLGGQVALDAKAQVLEPDDIVSQTRIALSNIAAVLAEFDATMDDIVKVTTFYQGAASAEELHKNLIIRSNAFTKPGPATSGIPVPHLVYERMMIEIEVIAIARSN